MHKKMNNYQKQSVEHATLRFVDDEIEVNEWLENSDDENLERKTTI
jgi:hypothetical protein